MRGLRVLLVGAALAVGLAHPAAAQDLDPIVGRWEFSLPNGAPFAGGPTYDIVAAGPGAFTTRVVRNWGFGCQAFDGQLALARSGGTAAQPAYRGTEVVLTPPLCQRTGTVEVEFAIGPDGLGRLVYRNGSNVTQHYRRVSLRIDTVLLTFRERIEAAIAEARRPALALKRRWETLEASIPDLLAEARRREDTSAAERRIATLERELADAEKNLARVEAALRRSPRDPKVIAFREAWERRALSLSSRLSREQLTIALEEQRRRDAEAALQRALAERSKVARQLLDLGRRIAGLDFDIQELTGTVAGSVVFRAVADSQTAGRLRELDETIAVAQRALAGLERERAEAKAAFVAAQREVIAAGERLVGVFKANFLKTAALETGFLALDLGLATARGGFIGLAAEVGKKTAETLAFALTDYAFPPKGGGGDDVEAELRRLYGARVDDSFGAAKVARVGIQRTLKETVFKTRVKDPLTKYLVETVFNPLKLETAFDRRSASLARLPTAARTQQLSRMSQTLATARRRLETFNVRQRSKPSRARGLAESLLKDAAKATLKRQLELAEREAWLEYFELDLQARAYFPLLQTASTQYWEAKDGLDALLAERARLVQQRPDLRILASQPFPRGAALQINLEGRGRPGQLAVVLGGVRAASSPGFVYRPDTQAAQLDSAGKLTPEIR
jgi:hypothetical protein